eukprot:jgi/Tetstr1/460203/TSEL_005518.t1
MATAVAEASVPRVSSAGELLQPPRAGGRAGAVATRRARAYALAALWAALLAVAAARRASSATLELLVLYYTPLVPPLALLWLWAGAVGSWERRLLDYGACFPKEQHPFLLAGAQLAQLAAVVSAATASSAAAFCLAANAGWAAAAAPPPLLYAWLASLLALRWRGALFPESRFFFRRSLRRLMLPSQAVAWAEFLLADMLTSLSKPLSDAERAVCHMATGGVLEPLADAAGGRAGGLCGGASPAVPLALAAPALWRLGQCLRGYLADGAGAASLANAAKYASALPVIAASYMHSRVDRSAWVSTWQPLWLAASALNTAVSIYWDTERDWGVPWLGAGRLLPSPGAKRRRLYGPPRLYAAAVAANAALRVAWAYKLSPHLRVARGASLVAELAEVLRRFQWCFFRTETELWALADRRASKAHGHPWGPSPST